MEDKGVTVVLDTNLTEDLIREGYAREVISKLQTMRKEAGFEVTDRIHVTFAGDDKLASSEVFENKLPQLKSRQAMFPYLAQDSKDKILCTFVIGEAMESVDGTTYVAESLNGGQTWSEPVQIFDKKIEKPIVSDNCKITYLGGEKFICIGYAFPRHDYDLPIGNPITGGLLDDFVFYTKSNDGGKNWDGFNLINTNWKNSTEASAPITVLKNGDWVSPITGFPKWNGELIGRRCGRLLVSKDNGATWNDDVVCMEFDGDKVLCYEQRLCQLETGEIVVIAWNDDVETGEALNNHYTISYDNGNTFTKPKDTGVRGQASSICAIGGSKLFALHAIRKGSDRPGVYGYIVDLKDGDWNIKEEKLIWEPNSPIVKDKNMADIFSYLKFGQPSAIKLNNGNLMVVFWYCENGQYRVKTIEVEL